MKVQVQLTTPTLSELPLPSKSTVSCWSMATSGPATATGATESRLILPRKPHQSPPGNRVW